MAEESTDFSQFEEERNNDQYKVSAKKTVDEYKNLDAEDESLAKWKESLGLSSDVLPLEFPGDKRKVVVQKNSITSQYRTKSYHIWSYQRKDNQRTGI